MKSEFAGGIALAVLAGLCTVAAAAPFGNVDDIKDAADLWHVLEQEHLVGPKMIHSVPYQGQHPHGAILETLDKTITVGGHRGSVIVKRNFGGEGVSKAAVADDPAKYLGAVTVMFKREAGYDSDNRDWFWAKYKPDGSPDRNPKGMALAGRVAKGMPQGCIACHRGAPGGDYVFNNDRFR
ncbi:MAG: cytochrome P460 family protein [Rhodocyclaceae bacterium]|nr:cytochrome P460 family protein [Rhodocyclaceae bacterium]